MSRTPNFESSELILARVPILMNAYATIFSKVRTDFISIKGETLDSSSHPCMMRFKSLPIRLLLTLFKAVPLVTGFISEVQTLNVKLKDLNQGTEPTTCLKVVLEQRPAHGPGAGIPNLYGASLVLESKLPFIKRII
ncbi:hypothetical protein E1A91_D06G244600v1 [Gossypium mustelinum]|uniref:Uncharacterized protein n=1 Tax=Gossypium mustelinum TaxID=34275 RepID=A0A5D2UMS4_GOSMU|nr:hypothetical protein E1A91_D06G244600v1 [Gossypium mustelinum]